MTVGTFSVRIYIKQQSSNENNNDVEVSTYFTLHINLSGTYVHPHLLARIFINKYHHRLCSAHLRFNDADSWQLKE